jgi:hypothetical protein
MSGIYKAKVLVNKLEMVLGKVISKSWNAFIQGNPIHIANECLSRVFFANWIFLKSL